MPKGAWYVQFVSRIWLEYLALPRTYSSVTKWGNPPLPCTARVVANSNLQSVHLLLSEWRLLTGDAKKVKVFGALNTFFFFLHQPLRNSKLSRGKQRRRKPTKNQKAFQSQWRKEQKTEFLTALKSGEPDEFCLWILQVCSCHFWGHVEDWQGIRKMKNTSVMLASD